MADLTAEGVQPADISLIESESDPRLPPESGAGHGTEPRPPQAPMLGAVIGAVASARWPASARSPCRILDPLVRTGWVVPTITLAGAVGAVLGAVLGAVTRSA